MMYFEEFEGELKISDEHVDWMWVSLDDLKTLKLSSSLEKLLEKNNWVI